ncbi:NADPH-dependent FMN reductase [Mesonia sp. K7]|uniref:NADPH-dependent FMN reductase n=1 Tax=Mesonia sp. K7 TaxID=2218606 RepID=UPI000DA948E3|nr:NAD(P)H-dependent oxidoreductase [Mesonia sp. K7]PZD76755.1 NADPH-dependent FMN reductase [Mesonia sp. K7]
MLNIAIITGSTRPNRVNKQVADWVLQEAQKNDNAKFELVDIKDYDLPLLDEPMPAMQNDYQKEHTKKWSKKIKAFDAFIIVTPEYNHSTSAALKNAIDFLFYEWNDKAAGFVSYGSAYGARAVEHLRLIMAEVKVATVREQLLISLMDDFKDYTEFKPKDHHAEKLTEVVKQVISWGEALKEVRK